jgi:quercetin dioxygenase-like cupin family protein
MDQPRPRIGRKATAVKVEFTDPKRTPYVYFGKDDGLPLGCGICEIPPGSSNVGHDHPDADEVIYVIAGRVRFEFKGESHVLEQGEAIFVPRHAWHQIFNDGPGLAVHTFTFTPAGPENAIRRKYQPE